MMKLKGDRRAGDWRMLAMGAVEVQRRGRGHEPFRAQRISGANACGNLYPATWFLLQ